MILIHNCINYTGFGRGCHYKTEGKAVVTRCVLVHKSKPLYVTIKNLTSQFIRGDISDTKINNLPYVLANAEYCATIIYE